MLELVTAVATEPVTLAEAKLHLRVDSGTHPDDNLITALISVAREAAEHQTGRSLAAQTWKLHADCFGELELERPPVTSVTWVKYYDATNTQQTLSSTVYYVDYADTIPEIKLAYGQVWPVLYPRDDTVSVQYVTGYTTIPPCAKQWILCMIGALYENRELVSERGVISLGFLDRLLDPVRILTA